jgi:hypothetical protein
MTTPVSRYQVREKLINADEFSTGFYTTENYCERMKKHIQKMQELGGEHRNDIETYKNLMMKEDCTNVKVLDTMLEYEKKKGYDMSRPEFNMRVGEVGYTDEGHDILATGGRRTRRKARKNLRKSKNKKSRRFYRRKSKK